MADAVPHLYAGCLSEMTPWLSRAAACLGSIVGEMVMAELLLLFLVVVRRGWLVRRIETDSVNEGTGPREPRLRRAVSLNLGFVDHVHKNVPSTGSPAEMSVCLAKSRCRTACTPAPVLRRGRIIAHNQLLLLLCGSGLQQRLQPPKGGVSRPKALKLRNSSRVTCTVRHLARYGDRHHACRCRRVDQVAAACQHQAVAGRHV